MDAAVAQFRVVHEVLLRPFTRLLGHASDGLALTLALLNLLQHNLHDLRMLVEVVVQFALDEVVDELVDRNTPLLVGHVLRAEFHFRLALEDRLLHIDSNGSDHTVTDVREVHVFVVELLDCLANCLAESRLVRTALDSMLAVDEREILVVVLVSMRECNLNILAREVDNRVQWLYVHVFCQEVEEAVLGVELLPVQAERKAGVQIRVVAHHRLDVVCAERVVLEETFGAVRLKLDECATRRILGIVDYSAVADQVALLELSAASLAFAEGLDNKPFAEHIHRLGTHTVKTHTFLEGLGVVFAARVKHRHCIDHLAQRYAAAIVTHAYRAMLLPYLDLYINNLAFAHTELVNRVVDGFFDKHVDTVVRVAAVAQFADIHTRPTADVLAVVQVDNIRLIV